MESFTKISWTILALIHVSPALSALKPKLIERLYGIAPQGDMGVLMTHRGFLFLAMFATCIIAIFSLESRKLASIILSISVLSFLFLYTKAGLPSGPLRKIAIADVVGLLPLAFVIWQSWK